MQKLISWNVNGLRACMTKGFLEFFRDQQADVFCIQETKMQQGQAEVPLEGYHQYWNSAEKKGYSGTAVFCKEEPLSVSYDLHKPEHTGEGRADKEGVYSWWSYRFKARQNNAGWRIDYFLTSERLKDKIQDSIIHTEQLGSDHCPVELRLEI